jgi:Ca2+-binding RTX toxin-like protein
MRGFDLVGGHAVMMRAWHNSDATNIAELKEDLQTAEAFQYYLTDPTSIIALMLNQPESDLAQSWSNVLRRAAELKLHLPSEKDLDGGWDEILIAQGMNPELIPSINENDIVITDPNTGIQTVLHHIIGPGYEIVKFKGTDGNDIIQVHVDGPSITYIDAGAGNDTVTGTEQADIIVGGAGDDIIDGLGGNDWLYGGDGQDLINGGNGDDLVVGGYDNDILRGGNDQDSIHGSYGNDILYGDVGLDHIYGGKGDDTLYASNGEQDRLYGEDGDDTLHA